MLFIALHIIPSLQVTGMVMHFIICNGVHPYGPLKSPISVDSNIRAGQYKLTTSDDEARHLLTWMLYNDAMQRKDSNICLT